MMTWRRPVMCAWGWLFLVGAAGIATEPDPAPSLLLTVGAMATGALFVLLGGGGGFVSVSDPPTEGVSRDVEEEHSPGAAW